MIVVRLINKLSPSDIFDTRLLYFFLFEILPKAKIFVMKFPCNDFQRKLRNFLSIYRKLYYDNLILDKHIIHSRETLQPIKNHWNPLNFLNLHFINVSTEIFWLLSMRWSQTIAKGWNSNFTIMRMNCSCSNKKWWTFNFEAQLNKTFECK